MDVRGYKPHKVAITNICLPAIAGLYQAIYHYVLSKPVISELTVEDPAEAFEDLRDRNDLKMLLSHEQFIREAFGKQGMGGSSGGGKVVRKKDLGGKKGKGKLEPPSDKMWMEKWRKDLKIAGVSVRTMSHTIHNVLMVLLQRQFSRLVEMLILLHLDSTNPLAIKAYRLQVKERLYRFNFVSWVIADIITGPLIPLTGSSCSTGGKRKT